MVWKTPRDKASPEGDFVLEPEQELAVVQHTLDLGAPPHPISQPLPGGLVPSGPCPAPADAQALRPQAPGKMEEGQSRQDGTLPPALLVLELSVSSPRTQWP